MGTGGGAVKIGRAGKENSEAGLPIRTAIACSYCARKMPRLVSEDWADCRVVRASTTESLVADAGVVLGLVVVQRLLIGSYGWRCRS